MANGLFGLPDPDQMEAREQEQLYRLPAMMAQLAPGQGLTFAAGLLGAGIGDLLTTSKQETKIKQVRAAYKKLEGKKFDDPLEYAKEAALALSEEGLQAEALQILFNRNQLLTEQQAVQAKIAADQAKEALDLTKVDLAQKDYMRKMIDTLSQADYRTSLKGMTEATRAREVARSAFGKELAEKFKKDKDYILTPEDQTMMLWFSTKPMMGFDALLNEIGRRTALDFKGVPEVNPDDYTIEEIPQE